METKKAQEKPLNSKNNEIALPISKNKILLLLLVLLSFAAIIVSYPLLAEQPFVANIAKLLRGNRVETGYIKNGNYTKRIQDVSAEVMPKEGIKTKLVLGDLIPKMVSLGIIDTAKVEDLYKTRGGLPKEQKAMLTQASNEPLTVTLDNANWLVNILWPLGLANKLEVNKQSPVYGKDLYNFASTGGWDLGKEENGGAYFSKYALIPLTKDQEKRVQMLASNTYRPCCNNSTFFQDCNHGSAGMAIIELGVKQGLSDREIYKTLLAFNVFWFPQNYNELALYFNVIKNTDWNDVDPKLALSKGYSSIGGWMANIATEVAKVPNLLPKTQGGGSCGA